MTNVDEIINELENELLAKKSLFGKHYVDEVKVTSLLSKLRESVPQAFYEAQTLLRQQDALIADAGRRADMILRSAEETRKKLVAESEVLAEAQRQAAELKAETERYCDEITESLHRKIDHALYDVAYKVNDTMNLIEDLRDQVASRFTPPPSGGGANPPSGEDR